MKTTIIQLALFLILSSVCNSQITTDYPFKTYLDSANNLYVTGYRQQGNTKDVYTGKFPPNNEPSPYWERTYPNPFGDDRGLDLAVDRQGNTFVTGYIFNNLTNSNDIITLKYNSAGILQWDSAYNNFGDDKGMGIDISTDENGLAYEIYITGYVTSPESGKDFIIKKYNNFGDSLRQDIFNKYSGDDVATEILLDKGFVYVIGYTHQNGNPKSDIMFLVYSKSMDTLRDVVVFNKPGTNEKPTGFVFSDYSDNQLQKSRCAVASVTDEIVFNNPKTKYLTLFFGPDLFQNMILEWSKILSNGPLSQTNTATSITADAVGDIYVSGYMFNYDNASQSNGLDFATVKYKATDGSFGWNSRSIIYYNFNEYSPGIDDKASSVKVNANKDIYVAGMSDGSQNGFSIVKYEQKPNNPNPEKTYDKVFIPNFVERDSPVTLINKYAKIELANDGTPLMVVMGWNESEAYWSAVKYNTEGEIEYTINNQSGRTDNAITDNNKKTKTEITRLTLDNYPNPFNPTTMINYELSITNYVTLKIYDIVGREVEALVNEHQNAGRYTVTFNGAHLSSGIYFYKLLLNGIVVETKRMLLVK